MAYLGSSRSIFLEIVLVLSLFLDTKIPQSMEAHYYKGLRGGNPWHAFRASTSDHSNAMAPYHA